MFKTPFNEFQIDMTFHIIIFSTVRNKYVIEIVMKNVSY